MTAALAFLRAHWKLIGLGLLLSLLTVQQLRLTGLKSSLSAEKAGRIADQESYRRAQAEAEAKAIAARAAQEKEYAKAAQAADADYDALRERYTGLLRNQGAGGSASGAVAPTKGRASQVHGDAAAVPVYVQTMPEADWLKLPGLQAYADQCFNWALSLDKVE